MWLGLCGCPGGGTVCCFLSGWPLPLTAVGTPLVATVVLRKSSLQHLISCQGKNLSASAFCGEERGGTLLSILGRVVNMVLIEKIKQTNP